MRIWPMPEALRGEPFPMNDSVQVTDEMVATPFEWWLSGLIDGAGVFAVEDRKDNGAVRYVVTFRMSHRGDEWGRLLRMIQRETGLGTVVRYDNRGKPGHRPDYLWRVMSRDDVTELMRLLRRCPLKSPKRKDFAIWAEAVEHWQKIGDGRETSWKPLQRAKARLAKGRTGRASAD